MTGKSVSICVHLWFYFLHYPAALDSQHHQGMVSVIRRRHVPALLGRMPGEGEGKSVKFRRGRAAVRDHIPIASANEPLFRQFRRDGKAARRGPEPEDLPAEK